jgi:hypothetical protein
MAKSVGSAANNSSRRCFTWVKVMTPRVPRTPLPTKFAAAEKHTIYCLRARTFDIYSASGGIIYYRTVNRLLTVCLNYRDKGTIKLLRPRTEVLAELERLRRIRGQRTWQV